MSQWEFGIELDGFLAVFLGDRTKIEPKQQARGEKIGRSGIRWNLEHFRKSGASVGVILCLNVGNTQNVGGVDVGAGIPGLDFLEIGDGLGRLFGEIQREAGELGGFGVVGIFGNGALQRRYGVSVIALLVVA